MSGRARACSRTAATRAPFDEVRAWRRSANAQGRSLSAWLRDLANRAAHGELVPARVLEHALKALAKRDLELALSRAERDRGRTRP